MPSQIPPQIRADLHVCDKFSQTRTLSVMHVYLLSDEPVQPMREHSFTHTLIHSYTHTLIPSYTELCIYVVFNSHIASLPPRKQRVHQRLIC